VYHTRSRTLLVVLALASIAIEAELMAGVVIHSAQFLWTAPFWLTWYLLAMHFGKKEPADNAVVPIAERRQQS
jgi:hypothetical protein